jgi:subtilisin family serine protease
MFAGFARDRPLHFAVLAVAMASILSLIFHVYAASALQTQNGLEFVQLPLPLPGTILHHLHQQSRPINDSRNGTQQTNSSAPNGVLREAVSSDVVIPNQYIIMLKSGSHPHTSAVKDQVNNRIAEKIMNTVEDKLKKIDASIIFTNNFAFNGFTVKIPDPEALDVIKQDPHIAFIEQDKIVHINSQIMPTGVKRVGADLSSAIAGNGFGDVDADIAVLDTGISLSHPDLNVYRQQTFVQGTTSADDDNGHGTHVAGIAAAKDNSIGVVGVAPGARLWAVKVLDKDGAGAISTKIKGID